MQVRPIAIEDDRLVYAQAEGFSDDLAPELKQALLDLTGKRWQVEQGVGDAEPTLVERERAAKAEADAKLRAHPLVEAAFAAFPEAELVEDDDAGAPPWSRTA